MKNIKLVLEENTQVLQPCRNQDIVIPEMQARALDTSLVLSDKFQSNLEELGYAGLDNLYLISENGDSCSALSVNKKEKLNGVERGIFLGKFTNPKLVGDGLDTGGDGIVYLQDLVILGAMIDDLLKTTEEKTMHFLVHTPDETEPSPSADKEGGKNKLASPAASKVIPGQVTLTGPRFGAGVPNIGLGKVYNRISLSSELRKIFNTLLKDFYHGMLKSAFKKVSELDMDQMNKDVVTLRTLEIDGDQYYVPPIAVIHNFRHKTRQLPDKESPGMSGTPIKDSERQRDINEGWSDLFTALISISSGAYESYQAKTPEKKKEIEKKIKELSKMKITTGVQSKLPGLFIDGNYGNNTRQADNTGCIDKWSKLDPRLIDNWAVIVPALTQMGLGTSAGVATRFVGKGIVDGSAWMMRTAAGYVIPTQRVKAQFGLGSLARVAGVGGGLYGLYTVVSDYLEYSAKTGQAMDAAATDQAGIQSIMSQLRRGISRQADEKCFWAWFVMGSLLHPAVFTRFIRPAFGKTVSTIGDLISQSGRVVAHVIRRNSTKPQAIKMLEDPEYSELATILNFTDPNVLGRATLSMPGIKVTRPLSSSPVEIVIDVVEDGYRLAFNATTELGKYLKESGRPFQVDLTKIIPNAEPKNIIDIIVRGDFEDAVIKGYEGTQESFQALQAIVAKKAAPGAAGVDLQRALITVDPALAANQLSKFGDELIKMGKTEALGDFAKAQSRSLLHAVLDSKNAGNILNNTENMATLLELSKAEKLTHLFINLGSSLDDLQALNHKAVLQLLEALAESRKIITSKLASEPGGFVLGGGSTGMGDVVARLEIILNKTLGGGSIDTMADIAKETEKVTSGLGAMAKNIGREGGDIDVMNIFSKITEENIGYALKCLDPEDLKGLLNALEKLKEPSNLAEQPAEIQKLFELLGEIKIALRADDSESALGAYINTHEELANVLSMLLRAENAVTNSATTRGVQLIGASGGTKDLVKEIGELYALTGAGKGRNIEQLTDLLNLLPKLGPFLLRKLSMVTPQLSYLGAKILGASPFVAVAGFGYSMLSREMFDNNKERLTKYIRENGKEGIENQLNSNDTPGLQNDYNEIFDLIEDEFYESFEGAFQKYKKSLIKSSREGAVKKNQEFKKELGGQIVAQVLTPIFERIEKQENTDKENNFLLLKYLGTHSLYHGLMDSDLGEGYSDGVEQLGTTLRENFWKSIDINLKNGSVQTLDDLVKKFMFAYHKAVILNIAESSELKGERSMTKRVDEINRKILKNIVIEVLKENSGLGYSSLSGYDRETAIDEENPEDVSKEFDSFLQHYDRDKTNSAALELAKTLCSSEDGLEAFREMLELSKQLPELQKELVILMRNDEAS